MWVWVCVSMCVGECLKCVHMCILCICARVRCTRKERAGETRFSILLPDTTVKATVKDGGRH